MRSIFKKKLACLLFVIVFTFTTVVGCGNVGEDTNEILTDNNVTLASDEETTAEDTTSSDENNATGEGESSDNAGEGESTGGDTSGEATSTSGTVEGESETTTTSPSGESKPSDELKPSGESQTTSKKQETVTTKKQETTTKKQETTTKKQEATTAKPAQQETTTKKPTSSGNSSTGSSSNSNTTLSNAEKMAKEIVNSIIKSGMSDFDKAITIHDWLTYNLDYDFTYSHYYVEETLRDRTCVCQGYALTFKMMCEMAGLSVGYVTGTGTNSSGQTESHAWNQVKIDGKWYNVDVTWDDPANPGKDRNDHSANRYDYFLISDARIEKNHTTSDTRQTCPSDYDTKAILKAAFNNGYNEKAAFVENATQAATAIKKFVDAGKTEFILWYYDSTLTQGTMFNPLSNLLSEAAYPVQCTAGYPPENGVVKYVITGPAISEWNSIPLVTTKEALADLINANYAAGKKTFDVRFEPADGVIQFAPSQYSFKYSPTYYNNGKSVLLEIIPAE